MSNTFIQNQVGNRLSLDIVGSYPTGLMAALGRSYNDQQELINAQIRYNATQANINSQKGAEYASYNNQKEKSARLPTSFDTQIAALEYDNASSVVNYINQGVSDNANTAYTRANAVHKLSCDASYTAYLTVNAMELVAESLIIKEEVASVGKSTPDINIIDTVSILSVSTIVANLNTEAHTDTVVANANASQFLFRTRAILDSAIIKSRTVTKNLQVILRFNALVKSVIKNLADPLQYIAGKELLVTQHVPHPPLASAINVAENALAAIKSYIQILSSNQNIANTVVPSVVNSDTIADTLDAVARAHDNNMYSADATIKALIQSALTMKSYGSDISFPSEHTITPNEIYKDAIDVANGIKKVALDADISAVNARLVSNSIISLHASLLENTIIDSSILPIAKSSLNTLNTAMESVRKVTNNMSAYAAIAITLRASNTINGILSQITLDETNANTAYSDANSVLSLLNKARADTVVGILTKSIAQDIVWTINAATDRAREVSEMARDRAYILSNTARNNVTPQNIAFQTASANRNGTINNNYISRLDRNSRNARLEPVAYKSFQAEIRAQTFHPVKPSLDELLFKNRITPLRVDSIRTVVDGRVKVAQQVQRVKDNSRFSYTQQ